MKHLTIQQHEKLLNLKVDLFEQNLNQQIIDLKVGNMFLMWSNDLSDWIDLKNIKPDQYLVDEAKKEIQAKINFIKGISFLLSITDHLSKPLNKMIEALKQLQDAVLSFKKTKPVTFPNGGIIGGTIHGGIVTDGYGKEFIIRKPTDEKYKQDYTVTKENLKRQDELLNAINEMPTDGGILSKHWGNVKEFIINHSPYELIEEEVKELCHCCGKDSEYECERCNEPMCSNCHAPYNQFSQIDYNCCVDCYDKTDY